MKSLRILLSLIFAAIVWAGLVLLTFTEGWLHESYAEPGDIDGFIERLRTEINDQPNGSLTIAVIDKGKVVFNQSYRENKPINTSPVYQMASVSKWVTSWGVLKLVEQGKVQLDAPVSDYITRWSIPESTYDHTRVTVRRLLSHSSGLGDSLGYLGFDTEKDLQTIEESLSAPNGNGPPVSVTHEPGEKYQYSGGGYTLLQLMIEEVSGKSFPDFMQEAIFSPMGLSTTTFDRRSINENHLAINYDSEANIVPYRHYTALAAASVFMTAEDGIKFLNAHTTGGGVLSEETLALMRRPHIETPSFGHWGLGPTVLVNANHPKDAHIIGHDGGNIPAIRHALRVDTSNGDGIIIMGTGPGDMSVRIPSEWVFWKTGHVTMSMFLMQMTRIFAIICTGWAMLVLVSIIAYRNQRKIQAGRNK